MKKLIGIITAAVLSTGTLAYAAPLQGAMGKAAETAGAKAKSKPGKGPKAKKAKDATPTTTVRRGDSRTQDREFVKEMRRSLKADEKQLKWLRNDLRAAERAGNWRRAESDRSAIRRLEAQIRAERQAILDYERGSRNVDARNRANDRWGWWR